MVIKITRDILKALSAAAALTLSAVPAAWAQDASEVAENITGSVAFLPGLIAGISYLLGIILCVTAVLRLKGYIENPSSSPMRSIIVRFLAGGALFGMPIVLAAMASAISGQDYAGDFAFSALLSSVSGIFAQLGVGGSTGSGFNEVLDNIVSSIHFVPGLISAVAYLLGLVMAFSAVIKLKDHVESPENTKLHEGVIRLLVGGALFSLPTVYAAMMTSITGENFGGGGLLATLFNGDVLHSNQANQACAADAGTFGGAVCHLVVSISLMPSFLSAISYLFGLVLGMWALLKIRDHVLDPRQTHIWEGASRLIAGGMFFALPYVVEVAVATVTAEGSSFITGSANTNFNETAMSCGGGAGPGGLDTALYCLMMDILAPVHAIINFFALVAGIVFVMIGISRLMKNAQEGAKGPGGIGTLMTFLTGGILISFNSILGAVSQSMFGSAQVLTYATLSYRSGLEAEAAHVETVISAILKFMIMVGLISFVRGWFLMRAVAEGNNQASAMAATTHIIGGALAVNLGPLLNAVQATLGIDAGAIGVTFGGG